MLLVTKLIKWKKDVCDVVHGNPNFLVCKIADELILH